MASKHGFKAAKSFLIVLLALCPIVSFAEEAQFEQRIEWQSDATALEYHVELVSESGFPYPEYSTEKTYLDLTLPVGTYRYRVKAIDYLGRVAATSEWREFSVYKAAFPQIDVVQKTVTFASGDKNIILPVVILNINEKSTVTLERSDGKKKQSQKAEVVINVSSAPNENAISEVFRSSSVTVPVVDEGTYFLRVTNLSGLSADSEPFTVARQKQNTKTETVTVTVPADDSKKDQEIERLQKELSKAKSDRGPMNMRASFVLGPAFAPYDGSLKEITGLDIMWQGAIKFSVLPLETKSGYSKFGMEFTLGEVLAPVFNQYIKSFLSVTVVDAAAAYEQRLFSDSFAFVLRAGAGAAVAALDLAYIDEYLGRTEWVWESRIFLCATAGASLLWKPLTRLAVELGCDVLYVVSASMPTLCIEPFCGVGICW